MELYHALAFGHQFMKFAISLERTVVLFDSLQSKQNKNNATQIISLWSIRSHTQPSSEIFLLVQLKIFVSDLSNKFLKTLCYKP